MVLSHSSGVMRFAALLISTALLLQAGQRCNSCERAASGRIRRSTAARRQFRRLHPCPLTGMATGPCPGYVIDHVIALECGGPDTPSNMQWQTRAEARGKDRWERAGCPN
jgi:hypothetical protein